MSIKYINFKWRLYDTFASHADSLNENLKHKECPIERERERVLEDFIDEC